MLKKRLGVPREKALRRGRVVRVGSMVTQATIDAWRQAENVRVASMTAEAVAGLRAWIIRGPRIGIFGQ